MLIDIVDDVAGFGDHDAIVNQYRHEPLRVDCDELRRQMLVVRKVHRMAGPLKSLLFHYRLWVLRLVLGLQLVAAIEVDGDVLAGQAFEVGFPPTCRRL
jgi:hypothetical protein